MKIKYFFMAMMAMLLAGAFVACGDDDPKEIIKEELKAGRAERKAREKAAKEKKENYIFDNHDHVMSVYEVLKEKINQATGFDSGSEGDSEVLEFKPEGSMEEKSSDDVLEFAPMEEE